MLEFYEPVLNLSVGGVNRVLWDISEKPVATIEFE